MLYLFASAFVVSVFTEIIIIEKNRRSLTRVLDKTAKAYAAGHPHLNRGEDSSAGESPGGGRGSEGVPEDVADHRGHGGRVRHDDDRPAHEVQDRHHRQ